MKKLFLAISAFALLLSCHPASNPGGNEDNGKDNGKDNDGNKEVVATAIKLSTNDLTLEKGGNEILTVAYTPSNTTKKDITWVSSNTSIATVTDGIVVGVAVGNTEIIAKCGDAIDRCKVTVVISATGIGLDKTSLELIIGDSETLVASVEPAGSTDTVVWETSDAAVATVTDGVVTAVGAGEATITAKAGDQKAECKVTVSAVPAGAVDLGIVMTREDGTKYKLYWAKSNLSASGLCTNPEDYGDYYAWGETEPKSDYSWSTYKWGTSSTSLTKYNTSSSNGTVDNITELQRGEKSGETVDDAARAVLGRKWRMPTDEEWTALRTQCTWTWTTQNGIYGRLVTSSNGNSIFLPAAGIRYDTGLGNAGSGGRYWSSSLDTDDPIYAWYVRFNSDGVLRGYDDRCYGLSVRPVSE